MDNSDIFQGIPVQRVGSESYSPGWTIDTLSIHIAIIRQCDKELLEERDRRYAEVKVENEKALKVKEIADLAALELARDAQTYKEQQNDALRDRNLAASGIYATNESVASAFSTLRNDLQPLVDFVSAAKGASASRASQYLTIGLIVTILGAMIVFTT